MIGLNMSSFKIAKQHGLEVGDRIWVASQIFLKDLKQ